MILRETKLGAKVVFGIESEDAQLPVRVWRELVNRYFTGFDSSQMDEINKMLKYFGGLRCLIMVAKHSHLKREDAIELVEKQRKELLPYADEAAHLFSKADNYFK